jgi:hypothetical protein
MKTQLALLDSSNKLQFTDENDILYCVETTNDTVDNFEIEFSAWRNGRFAHEFFNSVSSFEIYCKEEAINIDAFRLYDTETDAYIDAPEEPVEEEGGEVEILPEKPVEEVDDTVVAVSYTDCYGQPQLAETPISPEERAKIEANMVGRHGNHGQEITWAILTAINRQANNTCWEFAFDTNTGTIFW